MLLNPLLFTTRSLNVCSRRKSPSAPRELSATAVLLSLLRSRMCVCACAYTYSHTCTARLSSDKKLVLGTILVRTRIRIFLLPVFREPKNFSSSCLSRAAGAGARCGRNRRSWHRASSYSLSQLTEVVSTWLCVCVCVSADNEINAIQKLHYQNMTPKR